MNKKNNPTPRCRVCNSTRLSVFVNYLHAPCGIERLLELDELTQDQPINLKIYKCNSCSFIQQLSSPLPTDYYSNYDKSSTCSPTMKKYQNSLAVNLSTWFPKYGNKVLEAGSGDGFFASCLKKNGGEVTAVEPGAPAAQATRDLGITTIESIMSQDLPLIKGSFDFFICRQVISHIENMDMFFKAVSTFLKPGGLGLIEAPNINLALEEKRYFDFFADYMNFFTPHTLWKILDNHKFEVLETNPFEKGHSISEYFHILFQNPSDKKLSVDHTDSILQLKQIVTSEINCGHRLACWGAGGRGITILSLADFTPKVIKYVVDSSPEKQGSYLPGTHIPVLPPETLSVDPVDTIIITAVMYENEILQYLRNQLGYSGRIITMLPHPKIMEE